MSHCSSFMLHQRGRLANVDEEKGWVGPAVIVGLANSTDNPGGPVDNWCRFERECDDTPEAIAAEVESLLLHNPLAREEHVVVLRLTPIRITAVRPPIEVTVETRD